MTSPGVHISDTKDVQTESQQNYLNKEVQTEINFCDLRRVIDVGSNSDSEEDDLDLVSANKLFVGMRFTAAAKKKMEKAAARDSDDDSSLSSILDVSSHRYSQPAGTAAKNKVGSGTKKKKKKKKK